MHLSSHINLLSGLLAIAAAQTYTSCNPLHNSSCPTDPALGKTLDLTSFSKTPQGFKEQSKSIHYDSGEVEFTIDKSGNAPTLISNFYIFFGTISVIMKAAPGTGIVSSVVLESDDLDEVDWEWLGGNTAQVETNYFGKGDTSSYDRATYVAVEAPQDKYHNYTLDWTSEKIDWIIDDKVIRTLNFADANGGKNFPQTPMTIRIGSWAGGDSSNPEGTIEWAGGKTDYSQGPFTMKVKALHIVDASSGSAYEYGDDTGSWKSIKILKGDAAASSASEGQASASASATDSQDSGFALGKTTGPASATSASETSSGVASTATVKASKVGGADGATITSTDGDTSTAAPASASGSASASTAANASSSTPATGGANRASVTSKALMGALVLTIMFGV